MRAALALAIPFHSLIPPVRVTRSALCAVPAMPTALRSCSWSSPESVGTLYVWGFVHADRTTLYEGQYPDYRHEQDTHPHGEVLRCLCS